MLRTILSSSLSSDQLCPLSDAYAHLHPTRITDVKNSQTFRHFPVDTSHIRIVLSAAPVTKNLDWSVDPSIRSPVIIHDTRYHHDKEQHSQSHATVHTVPLCPLNVPSLSPFEVNHTLTILSFDAENSRSPSAL